MNKNELIKLFNLIKTKDSNIKLKKELEANIVEYLELIEEKENIKSYQIKKIINLNLIKLEAKIKIKKEILNFE